MTTSFPSSQPHPATAGPPAGRAGLKKEGLIVRTTNKHHQGKARALAASLLAIVATLAVMATSTPAIAAEPGVGDPVYVGAELQGYGGTGLHAIYTKPPADPNNPGPADYWAYCIEHNVTAKDYVDGNVEASGSYLGSNYYTSTTIQGKVLWILAHSYPYMSLSDFGTAVGHPNISANDAIEATQYAIWRYTDLNYDANWGWTTNDSKDAYWYLVNGANASNGMTPGDLPAVTASITAPAGAQDADTLVGPFTVHTNQATASVTTNPAYDITDAQGNPINAGAVTDGQQIYLDLRGSKTAGSATVTVAAKGSNVTGRILSVPNQAGGTPTSTDHAQSLIMVAPTSATVSADARVAWAATPVPPSRGTPSVTTRASASKVVVGKPLHDTVTISGFKPGGSSTGTAKLYGPFTSRAAARCTKANLAGTASFTPRNGTVRTTSVTVGRPGYYTWVASISADADNAAATHACGLVSETTLVHKPSYGTPVVDTGFSGIEPGSLAARLMATAPMTVRYAGVGVSSAKANSTGIIKGHVVVPHNVAQLGFLTPSAGLADAVGTTVIVGHVSDDRDAPGAFYRLTKAKKGQVITVRQGGHAYRFKVTSTKTYTRAHNGHPPASVFSTTGKHALVLISCAAKVVYPDGHFHYTRNIVVTATPIA